ncbi:DHH family phosphoesterase [Candidatus Parcubacteria bacterium]|nr:DHH family phosphoesterase [Candidatus Parcubacteria bacterium]
MQIKNLKKAANRIKKAVKNKEKIILYGDADPDGVCSVVILEETIKNLGGEVSACYFPDREKEGYGINENALNFLAEKYSPALFISLDLGIANFKEVEVAKKLGFEVIIVDHHTALDNIPLPKALVVNPKQKQDKYPFKELCAAGVTYKLSEVILGKNIGESLKNSFLELAAIATISDMMPQIKDNKDIVEQGLIALENTWRPGLQVFKGELQKTISTLNAAGIKNHINEAYILLTASSFKKAEKIAEKLIEKRKQKHLRTKEITEQTQIRIYEKIEKTIIFEGDSSWPLVLAGPVATRICREYKKPTFIFRIGKKQSQGAVRMPEGLDAVKAMASCHKLLETYGGHPPAAGFSLDNKNLEEFKECLIKYFKTI